MPMMVMTHAARDVLRGRGEKRLAQAVVVGRSVGEECLARFEMRVLRAQRIDVGHLVIPSGGVRIRHECKMHLTS